MSTQLVLDSPVTVEGITIVVVGKFVARNVAEITDVVNMFQVFEHRLTVKESSVVAEVTRSMTSEGL